MGAKDGMHELRAPLRQVAAAARPGADPAGHCRHRARGRRSARCSIGGRIGMSGRKPTTKARAVAAPRVRSVGVEASFAEVVGLIRPGAPPRISSGQHRTYRPVLADRRVHQRQARRGRVGRRRGQPPGTTPRAHRARPAWLLGAEPVAHAAAVRHLPWRPKTLTSGESSSVETPLPQWTHACAR